MKNKIIPKNKKEIEENFYPKVKEKDIRISEYKHLPKIQLSKEKREEERKYYSQLIYKQKLENNEKEQKSLKIAYISDLHLDHPKKKSKNIVKNNSKQIAKQLKKYNIDILLIAGDTSADINTFKNFIISLSFI